MRGSLRPVRFRLPRLSFVGRLGLVCVLLLSAAALVVDTPPGCPAPALPSPEPPRSEPSASRTGVPDGLVGVTVPLAEPAAGLGLRPGSRIDVLAPGAAGPVLTDALVLTADPGIAVLVAVPPNDALGVLRAPAGATFRVLVRPG